MACYKKFEEFENAHVEQNIWNNNELESYETTFNFEGNIKTAVLYYYVNRDNERFYSLGLRENLEGENIFIVLDDLSQIFKYKTARTRRKHLYNLIRENELSMK